MKLLRRRFLHLAGVVVAVAVLAVTLSAHGARSQAARTIKIVVPFAAGGVTDSMARLLAEQIGRTQGPKIVVEDRPGAGTVIGTEAVSRAAPDGNTVLIVGDSFVINAHVRKLTYDPLTSFEPICYLVQSPAVVVVNNTSPYRTLGDLLTAARAKPGELTMGASGPATAFQIAFGLLKHAANVNMIFVPYAGSAPAVSALLGEHVVSGIADYGVAAEHLRAGKLRALATTSRKRIEPLPEVPTVAESGFKGYEVDTGYGLVAPAKTPKETLSQLETWFTGAMQVSEVRAKLAAIGLFPDVSCGSDFGAHIRKKYEEYGRVIREANIKWE